MSESLKTSSKTRWNIPSLENLVPRLSTAPEASDHSSDRAECSLGILDLRCKESQKIHIQSSQINTAVQKYSSTGHGAIR